MKSETNAQTGRGHQVGTLAAPLLKFGLDQEIQQLRSEGRWESGHTAKTLAKYSDLRVVLVVIESGGRIVKHRTEDGFPSTLLPDAFAFEQPSSQ